jgi:hypothetical protein
MLSLSLLVLPALAAVDRGVHPNTDLSWVMLPTVFWLPLKCLLELSMYLTVLRIRFISCFLYIE